MKRIIELDILRGFAIIGVITIHATIYVLPSYMHYWSPARDVIFLNQLARFATPLLIFLSGVTLTLSQAHRHLTLKQFYQRRFLHVLAPYIAFTIFFTWDHTSVITVSFFKMVGQNLLNAQSAYHMYFVLLILQLYLIFPFLYIWLCRLSVRQRLFLATTAACLQSLLLAVFMQLRLHNLGIDETFAFRFSGFWLVYFLLGMLFAQGSRAVLAALMRIPTSVFIFATTLVAIFLTFETSLYRQLPYDALNFFRPSIMLYCLCAVPLLIKISTLIVTSQTSVGKRLHRILHALGKNSLGIYFLHVFVLEQIVPYVLRFQMPYILSAIILATFTLIISHLMIWVYFDALAFLSPRIRYLFRHPRLDRPLNIIR